MKILILSILVMAFVFLMLYLSGESKDDFPFGDEPEEGDTQVNSQTITLDSANAEKLRRLDEAVGNWDNETTGY